MGYFSTGMGDHFSALLMYLMALRLKLVDQNPFWTCSLDITTDSMTQQPILFKATLTSHQTGYNKHAP